MANEQWMILIGDLPDYPPVDRSNPARVRSSHPTLSAAHGIWIDGVSGVHRAGVRYVAVDIAWVTYAGAFWFEPVERRAFDEPLAEAVLRAAQRLGASKEETSRMLLRLAVCQAGD